MHGGRVLIANADGLIESAGGQGIGFVLQSGYIATPSLQGLGLGVTDSSPYEQGNIPMPGVFPVRVRLHGGSTPEMEVHNGEVFRFSEPFHNFDIVDAQPNHCFRVITLTDPTEGFIPGQERQRVPFWLWAGRAATAATSLYVTSDPADWDVSEDSHIVWIPPNVVGYTVQILNYDGSPCEMYARSRTTANWHLVETFEEDGMTWFDSPLAWGFLGFKLASGSNRPDIVIEAVAECY